MKNKAPAVIRWRDGAWKGDVRISETEVIRDKMVSEEYAQRWFCSKCKAKGQVLFWTEQLHDQAGLMVNIDRHHRAVNPDCAIRMVFADVPTIVAGTNKDWRITTGRWRDEDGNMREGDAAKPADAASKLIIP